MLTKHCPHRFLTYVCQIIMVYILNLYSITCQLYLNYTLLEVKDQSTELYKYNYLKNNKFPTKAVIQQSEYYVQESTRGSSISKRVI